MLQRQSLRAGEQRSRTGFRGRHIVGGGLVPHVPPHVFDGVQETTLTRRVTENRNQIVGRL